VVVGPRGQRRCRRGCRGVGHQCSLHRRGPGTAAVAVVKGSQHGGGSDNDGVPAEAATIGSRWCQRMLQSLPWRSGGGSVRGKQNFAK
jgi:hypothetical protein